MMALSAATAAFGGAGTGTALTTASTLLGGASAVLGTISSINQANYQRKVAENNAAIEERNARLAAQNAATTGRDQDIRAAAEMAQLIAQQSASGFSLGSGSYALARKSQAELAARDRLRIAQQGTDAVADAQQRAADFRSTANAARSSARNAMLAGALNIGSTFLGGATAINQQRARSLVS